MNKSSRHDLMMNYLNAVREFGYCSPEVAEAYEKLVESYCSPEVAEAYEKLVESKRRKNE